MTKRTLRRYSLSLLPMRSICRVSGVVIITSGGISAWTLLSRVAVSPCLTETRRSRLRHQRPRRSSMSLFRARSGVMYTIFIPGSRVCDMSSWWSAGRKAASVLPVPAGEMRRTFLPSRIFGIAACWGMVGTLNSRSSRSLRIGLASRSKAF